MDTANKRFVLDVNKDRLQTAPGFDTAHWPDMADETWAKDIHAWYGTKPHQPRTTRLIQRNRASACSSPA